MSGTTWLDWRAPEGTGRRELSLEERAATALTIIALLNLPGIIVSPFGGPSSWLLNLTSVGATVGITALYLLAARAIRHRTSWSLLAIRPLLAVATAFGIYAMVVAAGQGWFKIPVDAVLATWAWLGRPESPETRQAIRSSAATIKLGQPERPPGRLSWSVSSQSRLDGPSDARRPTVLRASSIAVVVGLLQAAIWYGPLVFGWGGLLDVHQPDLIASVHVDCGAPGAPPTSLTVTYDWSWRARAVLPSGLDMVVIGWRGTDAQGRVLYLLGTTPDAGPGIQEGLQAFPDVDLAEQAERQTPGSWHWGIHLDRQALAPGRIQVQLQLAHASPPTPGPLTVTATYIHLGLWAQSAPVAVCSW